MIAQCTLYVSALKIFGTLWLYAHGYYSRNFSWAFVPIDAMNVPTKFEVPSFTRFWDNRGYPKKCAAPGYAHAPFSLNFYGLLFGLALKLHCDLETGVRGHSRSSKFKRHCSIEHHTTLNLFSNSNNYMYALPFPRYSRILVENRYHPCIRRPR